jgi:hypothetical protein
MTPEEERLKKMRENLSDYFTASRKKLDEDLAAIDDMSKAVGDFFSAFSQLNEIKKKEFFSYRAKYREYFLYHIHEKKDSRAQLTFVYEQITDLNLKIADSKAEDHRHHLQCYENVLNDIVLPFKSQLLEIVRLENEVGQLKKEETPPFVVEVKRTEQDIPVNEITQKVADVPLHETTEALTEKMVFTNSEQPKDFAEIFIPITLKDKPLETKNGAPLNNPEHIAGGRKFSWSDDRIPDLIGDFLLEKKCIFDYQLKAVQEFFRTSKSDRKIVFDGNANQLTTMLYDLKIAKYMAIFNDSLGEIIEAVFVKKGNTMQALIAQKSLVADTKRGSTQRRIKAGSPYYLDILSFLKEKLKTSD